MSHRKNWSHVAHINNIDISQLFGNYIRLIASYIFFFFDETSKGRK